MTLFSLGVFSASCSAIAAYLCPSQRTDWAIAGGATIAQLPWTLLFMMKTIKRLNAIAVNSIEQEKASKAEVVALLQQWAWMSVVRELSALVGGLNGIWAIIEHQK